jgi:acyl carrier protein
MKKRVKKIFEEVFGNDYLENHFDSFSMEEIDYWDSLKNIELLLAIQKEFKVKLDFSDLEKLKSYEGILKVLNEKG